ncbi:DUF2061 domain-containing protein [Tropicimonas isoalkanivorans]|uniref:Uncharacterized membrane protein n=1 Tax=Tropicimonas isoalkanivorans TaxID=441112 RepID=A0A1I1NLJ6_9RHOB|nr:DUF2061 domain-containing protein [Tropicimonas isoalkanivorans]SFC98335.1 Uncharacterized membrane protein [Tropicimonas isoalkanivorans]
MTETPMRSIVKAATWQGLGLVVMTFISWAVTGSVTAGSAIALLGMAVGLVTYVLHERLWAHVRWGFTPGSEDGQTHTWG